MQIAPVIIFLLLGILTFTTLTYAEEISVKEWEIPTANSAPHDIVVDKTGMVWFTEINTNKIRCGT